MKIDLNGFKKYLDSKSYSECTKTAYIEGVKSYIRHGYKEVSVELENEFRERQAQDRGAESSKCQRKSLRNERV